MWVQMWAMYIFGLLMQMWLCFSIDPAAQMWAVHDRLIRLTPISWLYDQNEKLYSSFRRDRRKINSALHDPYQYICVWGSEFSHSSQYAVITVISISTAWTYGPSLASGRTRLSRFRCHTLLITALFFFQYERQMRTKEDSKCLANDSVPGFCFRALIVLLCDIKAFVLYL